MSSIASIGQYEETSPSERREQNRRWHLPIVQGAMLPHKLFLIADLCLVWMSAGIAQLGLLSVARGLENSWAQQFPGTGPLGFMFLFSVLVVMFGDLRGLYDFSRKKRYREDLKLLADSVICAGIVIGTGLYLGGGRASSAAAFILPVVLTWISMAVWRRFIRSQSIPGLTEKRNVLIVGYGRIAHLEAGELHDCNVVCFGEERIGNQLAGLREGCVLHFDGACLPTCFLFCSTP